MSCHQTEFHSYDNELGKVQVSDNRIILTTQHIMSIKSERYQPSLTLHGRLIPLQQIFIHSPKDALTLFDVLVHTGQFVSVNEPLFRYVDTSKTVRPSHPTFHKVNKHTVFNIKSNDLSKPDITSQTDTVFHAIIDNQFKFLQIPLQQLQQPHNLTTTETLYTLPITTVNAPFSGIIQHVYFTQTSVLNGLMPTLVSQQQPILILRNENRWGFVSVLPKYTQAKLSIGQHVPFQVNLTSHSTQSNQSSNEPSNQHTLTDTSYDETLTGQISDIQSIDDGKIAVTVQVADSDKNLALKQGIKVQGHVNYGQMAVGTLIDKAGVHQIKATNTVDYTKYDTSSVDLSKLIHTNADVVETVKAYVWIIGQDRKLTRQVVDVIRYNDKTGQYLVSGIPNEVMICLVNLPLSAEGKVVKVS